MSFSEDWPPARRDFLRAKNFVIFGLTLVLAGVGIMTAGSAENILFSSQTAGLPLKITGVIAYLLGLASTILSLALSKDSA